MKRIILLLRLLLGDMMEKEYRFKYQYIVDGEVRDQITENSKLDLIKCIIEMRWQDKEDPLGTKLSDDLIKYLKER